MVLKGAYEEAVCPLALNPSLSIACTESRSGFPTSPLTAFQRALDSFKPAVVFCLHAGQKLKCGYVEPTKYNMRYASRHGTDCVRFNCISFASMRPTSKSRKSATVDSRKEAIWRRINYPVSGAKALWMQASYPIPHVASWYGLRETRRRRTVLLSCLVGRRL